MRPQGTFPGSGNQLCHPTTTTLNREDPDNSSLETFIDNELQYGLQTAVEAKVLADINATSGIQAQGYATSVLTTLRKGLTKLETTGYTPLCRIRHKSANLTMITSPRAQRRLHQSAHKSKT